MTLDDVADATREVSRVLDDSDVMGEQAYTLEVTSRGVDRPLTLPRHWRRNQTAWSRSTLDDGSKVIGRIAASDDAAAVPRRRRQQREIAYADIAKAKVQIEFNRPRAKEA